MIVFDANIDERLDGAGDLLHVKRSSLHVQLVVADQTAVKNDELRVCEEGVAPALERHFFIALRCAERLVDAKRNACRFESGIQLLELPLGRRRLDQNSQELAHSLRIHRLVDEKAADTALFEEIEDCPGQLVFIRREAKLRAVDENGFVFRLE